MSKLAPQAHAVFMRRELGNLYALGFKCSACGHFNQLDHFPSETRDYCCEVPGCDAREFVSRDAMKNW